jgi:hypothetical protein
VVSVARSLSAKLAAKYACLPQVKSLFEELSRTDETLAGMQAEFMDQIKRNRALREGKVARPLRPDKLNC